MKPDAEESSLSSEEDEQPAEATKDTPLIDSKEKEKVHTTTCAGCVSEYIMMIAFGIHGFFEGIALGTETEVKSIIMFSIAIILHKGPAVISMGTKLV